MIFESRHKEVLAHPMFVFLAVLTVANAWGFQSWRTLINNFMVETAFLGGSENGLVQSVREVPGFLALGVVYVLWVLREHRVAALSILTMGVGVALTGFFPSLGGLLWTTLLMSFGFHYFETTGQSLALQSLPQQNAPYALGKLRGYQAATNLAVGLVIYFTATWMDFKGFFLLFGLPVVVVGGWALLKNPVVRGQIVQNREVVLRRRYGLFYALTFLSGARRQVFVAFAMFLAVERFGFTVEEVTLLFLVNNAINAVASPLIGRSIMRFGERTVMLVEYAGLGAVFLGYVMAVAKWQLIALYVINHLLFSFHIALSTYFQKIADPMDIAPTVAAAFTINHTAAVIIPVSFGLFWVYDYRLVFLMGAALSVVSFLLALGVHIPPAEPGAVRMVAPESAA